MSNTHTRGEAGHRLARELLLEEGFEILRERWRPRVPGAGEVDFVCRVGATVHLIEVKAHREFDGQRLLSAAQRARLWGAAKALRAELALAPRQNVLISLLWINWSTGRVEFLENP